MTTVRARRGSDQIDIIHYSSKDKYLFVERFGRFDRSRVSRSNGGALERERERMNYYFV